MRYLGKIRMSFARRIAQFGAYQSYLLFSHSRKFFFVPPVIDRGKEKKENHSTPFAHDSMSNIQLIWKEGTGAAGSLGVS